MRSLAGFEQYEALAELRTPARPELRLRPKTLKMLSLLAANPGRVITKQELMDAVWPNVHVGDDSLFQCIREIRAALGDERRELIRGVSGRGYLFAVEVTSQDAPARIAPAIAIGKRFRTPMVSDVLTKPLERLSIRFVPEMEKVKAPVMKR